MNQLNYFNLISLLFFSLTTYTSDVCGKIISLSLVHTYDINLFWRLFLWE